MKKRDRCTQGHGKTTEEEEDAGRSGRQVKRWRTKESVRLLCHTGNQAIHGETDPPNMMAVCQGCHHEHENLTCLTRRSGGEETKKHISFSLCTTSLIQPWYPNVFLFYPVFPRPSPFPPVFPPFCSPKPDFEPFALHCQLKKMSLGCVRKTSIRRQASPGFWQPCIP